jgi:hypothetical protein
MIAIFRRPCRDQEDEMSMVAPVAPRLVLFLDLKVYQNYDLCHDREPDLYLGLYLSRSNGLSSDLDVS